MQIETLYTKYLKDVYRYAMFKLHSREEAEDVTSETFLRAASNIDKPVGNWHLWLIGIARNVVREKYRQNTKVVLANDEMLDVPDLDIDVVQTEIDAELVEMIKICLDEMEDEVREVIILKIWEGMNFGEISEVMNIKESAAKLRYYRGLEKIKLMLGEREQSKKLYTIGLPMIIGAIDLIKSQADYQPSTAYLSNLLKNKTMLRKLTSNQMHWAIAFSALLAVMIIAGVSGWALSQNAPTPSPVGSTNSSSSSQSTSIASTVSSQATVFTESFTAKLYNYSGNVLKSNTYSFTFSEDLEVVTNSQAITTTVTGVKLNMEMSVPSDGGPMFYEGMTLVGKNSQIGEIYKWKSPTMDSQGKQYYYYVSQPSSCNGTFIETTDPRNALKQCGGNVLSFNDNYLTVKCSADSDLVKCDQVVLQLMRK